MKRKIKNSFANLRTGPADIFVEPKSESAMEKANHGNALLPQAGDRVQPVKRIRISLEFIRTRDKFRGQAYRAQKRDRETKDPKRKENKRAARVKRRDAMEEKWRGEEGEKNRAGR